MKNHTIKLDGEDLELSLSFENWAAVEKIAGKVYELVGKISASELGLCDVVNIYHQMQSGTAKSQQEILSAILEDGLAFHMEEIVKMLGGVFTGGKKANSGKK